MLVFDQYHAWYNNTVSLVWHIISGPVRVISGVTFAVVQGKQSQSDHFDIGQTKNLVIYGQSLAFSEFWSDQ